MQEPVQHVIVSRDTASFVKFEETLSTASVEIFLLENNLVAGGTDDLLSFRARGNASREFLPLVALESKIHDGEKRLVAVLPAIGGDPNRIELCPKEKPGMWMAGTWFIIVEPSASQ